jgi:hypothetical protein
MTNFLKINVHDYYIMPVKTYDVYDSVTCTDIK